MSVEETKIGMTLYELNAHRAKAQRAGEGNLRKMQMAIDRFVAMVGVDRVKEVTLEVATSWRVCAQERMSFREFNNDLILLRKLMGHGLRLYEIKENPFMSVSAILPETAKGVGFSVVGGRHIHEVLDRIRCEIWMEPTWFWRYVLWFMSVTGARKAQVLGLSWGDVDFTRRTLKLCGDGYGEAVSIPMVLTVEGQLLRVRERILECGVLDYAEQVFNISRHSDKYGGEGLTLEHLDRFFWEFERRHSGFSYRERRSQSLLRVMNGKD